MQTCLHDNRLLLNVAGNALVWQDLGTVNVDFILDFHIVTQDSAAFSSGPLSDSRVPTDNCGLDQSVVLDLGVGQQNRSSDSGAFANDNVWTNDNIWTNQGTWVNLGSLVNQDVAEDVLLLRQSFWVLLGNRSQVKDSTGQEVLWSTNVHPETFQVKGVQGSLLNQKRESFFLNRGWLHFNSVNDRWVQDVQTSIDSVTDKLNWLLNESVNQVGSVSVVNNDTILGWLIDLSGNNRTLTAVCLVELGQFLEWVVANDIGVQDKEWRVILLQDLFSKLQRTSSSHWLFLEGKLNVNTVFLGGLLQGFLHVFWSVVDSQDDVGDASSNQGFDSVHDHWSVTKLNQWLRLG
ncbi:mannose-1-phosphate guanyltransferase [Clavispora lusitaniae ATCC 42720]|uniref:Mannose-1-phosphate guanyltransferase n=1 Tax=Clavispora lusitaniae (strain ATCC 42720) TaxID=306902 RepID=C4Y4D6_CLAL4|nr:mannose-1-phosphate guanyltransferase [Clavispora lusitaniae ATCC 42720]EEQ38382.1 mannose-1-phosphate guanyltransferase [Clavispora lusitaniae ATCC 42720]